MTLTDPTTGGAPKADVAVPMARPAASSRLGTMWSVFRSMPIIVKLATIWLGLVVLGALYAKLDNLLGGALPLQDPLQQTNFNPRQPHLATGQALEGPSAKHLLGTDGLARDTVARLMHGAWVSLVVAAASAIVGVGVGGFFGALVGFVRGKTETVVMAAVDVILAFPALILLLAMVSIFEVRNLYVISGVIGFLSIPAYTRVARANSLAIANREFVLAARAIGTKPRKILFQEILPNVLPTLVSYALVAAAFVIVVEGSLSFLGLSVPLPTPTWGNMINDGRKDIRETIMPVLYPSLALTLTVLSLNQVGDWFQKRRAVRGSAL